VSVALLLAGLSSCASRVPLPVNGDLAPVWGTGRAETVRPVPVRAETVRPVPVRAETVSQAEESTLADVRTETLPGYAPTPLADRKNAIAFSLGASVWDNLGDINPASSGFLPSDFGEFEDVALHIGLSYYRHLVALDFLSFWLGLEFGLQSFENEEDFDVLLLPSGDTVDGSFYADVLVLTPGARLNFDVHDWVDLFVGGGGGLYHLEFDESFAGYSDDIDEDSAAGGFLSAGVEILFGESGMGVRVEHQVHFFEFENFHGVLPGHPDIDGPMHVSRLGFIYRF
jgi:opacity protein-like surface antigen